MPGTGKHGYTGYTSTGQYISNGIIQSSPSSSSSSSTSAQDHYNNVVSRANNSANAITNAVQNGVNNVVSNSAVNQLASNMAGIAGTGDSDYAEYLRKALDISANNTALSQQMAREQMDYQRQSDQTAMAWSANEAAKNRQWQEKLANTAHVREVQDLIKAGLNPILAANNGAYTGSGATGQGFSSSGAMGQVDTTANGILGQLVSSYINTASQAAVAKMYTDATRYQADMSYAMNKANIEANMLMQDKNISSNEKMNKLNSDTALSNANTAASASLGSSSMMAGATVEASMNSMTASIISSLLGNEGTHYTADVHHEGVKETNWMNHIINDDKITSEEKKQLIGLYADLYLSPYGTTKESVNTRAGLPDMAGYIAEAVPKAQSRINKATKSSGRGK